MPVEDSITPQMQPSVIPSEVEGSRHETFKVTQRDPSTPLRSARDDGQCALSDWIIAREFGLSITLHYSTTPCIPRRLYAAAVTCWIVSCNFCTSIGLVRCAEKPARLLRSKSSSIP